MIVVDQRTDREKLVELLHLVEEDALDYKSEIDISKGRPRLNFVKDAVAMSNRSGGGYILFGVTDDGRPCQRSGTCQNRREFDGANLGEIVRSYVDGEFRILTQWHDIDGCEVLLAYIQGHRDGLPASMTKIGQYDTTDSNGKKETKYAFHAGQIFLREGPENVTLRHAHWGSLLRDHDEQIRAESNANIQSVLRRLASESLSRQDQAPPLLMDMAPGVFAKTVVSHLDAGRDIRLRQFLGHAEHLLTSDSGQSEAAADRIAIAILQSLYFDRIAEANLGIDHFVRAFDVLDPSKKGTQVRLDILTRIYVIGSLAVRLAQWSFIHDLVLRPAEAREPYTFVYSSWIRAGQVAASLADLFDAKHNGMMISLARELMNDIPEFRPDLPALGKTPDGQLTDDDAALNSLCQFDLLYTLVVDAEGKHQGDAYPASSAFNQERADPIAVRIVSDEPARRLLFPTTPDTRIAEVLAEVYALAKKESHFRSWWSMPPTVQRFVNEQATQHR